MTERRVLWEGSIWWGCVLLFAGPLWGVDTVPWRELQPERIQEISTWLSPEAKGLGEPIANRQYWEDPALVSRLGKSVGEAAVLLTKEFPAWDDDAYLDFSKTGERARGEKMLNARASWLDPLVLAECLENKGRFLPLLNKVLTEYTNEPTWTLPAHDRALTCYHRQHYDIELRSALFSGELGETLYLLGNKLDPEVRSKLLAALNQRIYEPFVEALHSGKGCYWLGNKNESPRNNWNAVCLAGVTASALCTQPEAKERAIYVAAAEHYSPYYIQTFSEDGYAEEGVMYWGYGFGNYALLREEVSEASGGRIELFTDPKILNIALFGSRIRIGPHVAPNFGDCPFGAVPNLALIAYCNEALQIGLPMESFASVRGGSNLLDKLMGCTQRHVHGASAPFSDDPLRSYFADSGVLACRPSYASACHLGVAIKAGGNGSHSHNDVGSYTIAWDNDQVTGDPGGGSYNAAVFSNKRYDFKLLNSYGHPVPIIAGQLQIEATKAHPQVVSKNFTPDEDRCTMDITSAYAVPTLQKLTRTLTYNRTGPGSVRVLDEVTLTTAATFEEALITRGTWKQISDQSVELTLNNSHLLVVFQTPDGVTLKPEVIHELGVTFTRLGLALNKPVQQAQVSMSFTPCVTTP